MNNGNGGFDIGDDVDCCNEVILGEALQIEALGWCNKGREPWKWKRCKGVRNLGKETRGELLFLEGLQPKEQQKRTVEKSVEYFTDKSP